MGNQTLIPSQIQSVETYFLDLKNHVQFKSSLGSTTFMKTAKVVLIDSNGGQEEYILDSRLAAAMNVVGLGSGGGGVGGGSDMSALTTNTNNLMLMNVGAAMSPTSSSSTLTNQQQRQQTTQIRQRIQQLREQQQIVVVKIFPRYDMSIRLDLYSKRVKEIKHTIQNRYGLCTNCLPFHDLIITDKAAFLFRQYIKYNLYDRLSTRPFLTHIEKKWIAFQLLCAVNEIHALQIVHGDIKTENILINSFLWLSLSDFASYKPVYLSKNHPSADFNYYFDISRRRTCYLAPERLDWSPKVDTRYQTNSPSTGLSPPGFQAGTAADHDQSLPELMPPDPNDFKESMDIFSLGCVLAELFMERPLFDFAHLLSYRDGKYDPVPELKAEIKDESIFNMILSMISLDSNERKSANKYLQEQNDKAFPSYFVFLKSYTSQFIKAALSADEIVIKLKCDLPILLKNFKLNLNDSSSASAQNSEVNTSLSMSQSAIDLSDPQAVQNTNDAFLILLSVLLSSMRKLKFADNKLIAIDLMGKFSKFLDDSIVLDRILPYYLYFVDEQQLPIVKSHVVYALNNCLSNIRNIDLLNLNIFPELIFDKLDMLSRDDSYLVRSSVAKTISSFAETSRRFLEDGFLKRSEFPVSHVGGDLDAPDAAIGSARLNTNSATSYDKEFEQYQGRVSEIVMHLMIDMNHSSTSNAVKEALIRSDISRLCSFFGQLKTSEFLLPHMITILNEKTDWSIRAAFFDALCPVLLCIGWESVEIVKPLLEQGLKDGEEFVIFRTLISLGKMVEIGLLDRHQIIYFLSNHISPLLCHPSLWIRQGAVNYVVTICKQTKIKDNLNRAGLNTADILCSIAPLLSKFLQPKYSSLLFCYDRDDVLFNCLKRPIKRAVYDCISQDGRSDNLFLYLNQRSEIRCLTHQDYLPAYVDCSDVNVQQFFEKLIKLGFLEEDEDKLLHMKEFIDKIRISRLSSSLFNTDLTASNNSTTSVVMNNFTNSATNLKENFSIKDGFISIMKYQRSNCEYLNARASPFIDLDQKQQVEVPNSPESGPALGIPNRRDTLIDQYQLQTQTAPNAENVNAEWKMMFSGGARASAESDATKSGQRQRPIHPSPSYESAVLLQSPASSNSSTRFYTSQPPSNRIPINTLAKRFTDCTIEVEKYLDRCKFIYEEDKLRQSKVNQVRATINSSISSNTISLLPSVGKWKPKGILVAHSNEHTKEINKISRNSDSTYFSTCSAGEASVKIWATDNVLDGKSGFFKSVFTFDRSLPRTSNNETSTMTPSCTSFFDKNSLALLCEDFRFYIIDFNSNRTQYYLHTHDRVFKPSICRHFGLNANPAINGFDKTTFYYLNRSFKKSSTNLKCGANACYCDSNFPIEMIYLNESAPTWQMSATNTYEYFRGSNMKGLFCYSTSMGDVSCIDIRTRSKAFDVRRDLKNGYVTSMVTDPYNTWLAMGTSYGNIDIYDFRYMLPLQTFEHRSRSAVARLCNHPLYSNRIIASYQSNNEVSVWNMDSSQLGKSASKSSFMNTSSNSSTTPEMVFWGVQSVPPLCQNKMSPSYISSMIGCSIGQDPGSSTAGLICSSTDMKLRYIDLVEPHRESFVISAPFNLATPQNVTNLSASAGRGSSTEFASSLMAQNVQYDTRQIEGNKVLLELDQQSTTSTTSTNTGVSPTFSFNSSALTHQTYFTYHQDAITDLIVCYNSNNSKSQPLIISSSRDGALKVWR